MRKILMVSCVFFLVAASYGNRSGDHLGEKAFYKVDKDSHRTSSEIRSGNFLATVTKYLTNDPHGPSYEIKLDYDLVVSLLGRKTGSEFMNFPEEYFTKEFWEKLRKEGHYEHPKVKIKHEGYGDAKTLDGKLYKHCDKLYFYDIDTSNSQGNMSVFYTIYTLLAKAAGILPLDEDKADLEDLEIRVMAREEVPVLRGVKIDMSGVLNGIDFIVGSDYIAPQ